MTNRLFVVVGILVGVVLLLTSIPLRGQSSPSIKGVWKLEEVSVTGGNNPRTVKSPQPSVHIYTDRHFSFASILGDAARSTLTPAKEAAKLSDAEKLARYDHWEPFIAQSGTYEIKGNRLYRIPLVAKNGAAMTGRPNPNTEVEFKVEGKTLSLVNRNAVTKETTTTRYTRLE